MTCIRCSADSWTMVAHSSCSGVSGVSNSSVVMPSTPFIGVRISWLMRARNSLLARAPDSAASRAWRNSASWRMRAVTSVKKPVAPSSKGKIRSATTRSAPLHVERDVVGGRRAVGVGPGGAGRGEGRAEGGQRDVERLAEHRRARDAGRALGRVVPRLDPAVPPDHEHALVDRRDDAAQPGLGALHGLQHLRALHRAQHDQRQQLHDAQDDHDAGQRPGRERCDLGQLGLGALLLVSLHRAERHADALERGTALRQVAVDRLLRFAFENGRDDFVAGRQIGGPRAVEGVQEPAALAGVAGGREARGDRGRRGRRRRASGRRTRPAGCCPSSSARRACCDALPGSRTGDRRRRRGRRPAPGTSAWCRGARAADPGTRGPRRRPSRGRRQPRAQPVCGASGADGDGAFSGCRPRRSPFAHDQRVRRFAWSGVVDLEGLDRIVEVRRAGPARWRRAR